MTPPSRPPQTTPRLLLSAALGCCLLFQWNSSLAAGDAAKGKTLAETQCAACHGADGNSDVSLFPKLAGQQAIYVLRELQDYKAGRRQHDAMSPLAATLAEADMEHLAAYYAAQESKPTQVNDAKLLPIGKALYLEGNSKSGVPSCDGCHEEGGEGSKRFPRVAGQHADYTLDQIKQYATGKRSNGVKVMRTIAERLTDAEARALAEYMASLK